MLFTSQGSSAFRIPAGRPAIVLIGDDLEQSTGPAGFHLPSVRRAIRASRAFAVVSATPTIDVYAGLTSVAIGGVNVMIVETRLEHEFAWVELIQKLAPDQPLCISTVKGGRA